MTDDHVPVPKEFLKRLRLKDEEGGSSGTHNTAMPVATGVAALAGPGKAFAPAGPGLDKMQAAAATLQAEQGLDIGPSPYGTSTPSTGPGESFEERRKANALNPNIAPDSTQYHDGSIEVVLERNRGNAYLSRGKINGHTVEFLLDTGASQVSIPERVANMIGLKGTGGTTKVQTASGTVTTQEVMLDMLEIGAIQLTGVPALINPADRTETILLGMSALRRLQFTHDDDKIILRQKPQQ